VTSDDYALFLALVVAAALFAAISKRREPHAAYRLLDSRVTALERLALEGQR
jgi:hypothetical protein